MAEDFDATEPVAIIGAGAIGMLFGAAFHRAGHPITVCGGRRISQFRVTEGDRTTTVPITYTQDPTDIAHHRIRVLAVKAHNTDDVADWIRSVRRDRSILLVAQNGIEHRERVASYVNTLTEVVPCVIYVPVDRPAPGEAVVHRSAQTDVLLPDTPRSQAVADQLRTGGMVVENTGDFHTAAWRKLLTNVVSNPLTALTGRRVEVLREPGVADFARSILREAVDVALADQAQFSPSTGEETLTWLQGVPDGAATSMLHDRLEGRPLESDALTGAIIRAARRHSIETPYLEAVHGLISAIGTAETPRSGGAPA